MKYPAGGNRTGRGPVLAAAGLVAVFLVSAAYLNHLQPAAGPPPGTESSYHIGMARLYRTIGVPEQLPWMQFSIMNGGFSDTAFLFHAALAPFAGTDLPAGLASRAGQAAACFGALFATVFFWVLRRCRCPFAALWTLVLLCGAGRFLFRMTMLHPDTPALCLLVLSVPLLARRQRRHWPHFVLAALVTLTASSPLPVFLLALLFAAGRSLAGERPFDWKPAAWSLAGASAGLLVHPAPLNHLRILALHTQEALRSATGRAPAILAMARSAESSFSARVEIFDHSELPLMLLFVLLLAALARRGGRPAAGDTLGLFLCSAGLLVLDLAGVPAARFWTPFAVLLSAALLRDLLFDNAAVRCTDPAIRVAGETSPGGDEGDGSAGTGRAGALNGRTLITRGKTAAIYAAGLALCFVFGWRTTGFVAAAAAREAQGSDRFGLIEAAAVLNAEAAPGDVVFHTRWTHFPELFLFASGQRYLVGLDPLYMKARGDPYLNSWWYVRQAGVADPYPFTRGIFGATWLLSRTGQDKLRRRLGHDPRFRRIHENPSVTLYRLEDREMGFITEWLAAPAEGVGSEGGGTALRWTPYPVQAPPGGFPIGYINFRPLFSRTGEVPEAAAALTRIRIAGDPAQAEIRFGASGPAELRLNGETVLAVRFEEQMALIDHQRAGVRLAPGWNTLQVVSSRTTGDWGFFLRVTDAEGRPPKGLEVSATLPPAAAEPGTQAGADRQGRPATG